MRLTFPASLCIGLFVFSMSSMNAQQEPNSGQALPQGLSRAEWSSIQAQIKADRHGVRELSADEFEAHNPGLNWRLEFDGRGFLAQPASGAWSWGLQLESYGFDGFEQEVQASARMTSAGNRVDYGWDANLEEWYLNDRRGLEHGYTLKQRPAGASGSLRLRLSVRGDLQARLHPDGRGMDFLASSGGSRLSYSGLVVFDADGLELPAHFELHALGLLLLIDEAAARYPLTIDPIAQQAYIKASNTGRGDLFGSSAAISGDTLVVGAFSEDSGGSGPMGGQDNNLVQDAGAAYVFVRSAGSWTQQAYLKASNAGSFDHFGFRLAISGDTIVVGADGEDGGSRGVNGDESNDDAGNSGAAYVFVRSAGNWTQQAYLKASNADIFDNFGNSVSISGDTLVVGAISEESSSIGIGGVQADNSITQAGAAYVFTRSSGVWTQEAYLKASNTDIGDLFGYGVSISGDTLVVSSVSEGSNATGVDGNQADNSSLGAGAVYVFLRSAGQWTQQAYLKAHNTDSADGFGDSVAVSGDTLVIGASGEDSAASGVDGDGSDNGSIFSGAAYVFLRNGVNWSQQAYLKASNTDSTDLFGGRVAISDDRLVVGAIGEDSRARGVNKNQFNDAASSAGAAYVFERSAGTWSQTAYLKASNSEGGDRFGGAVAISGDVVVVGAYAESSAARGVNGEQAFNEFGGAGAAYAFDLAVGGAISFRNAGANPASYTAPVPQLGANWSPSVDLAGTSGHDFAIVVGYVTPASLVLGGGQVLLVNIADPAGRLFTLLARPGPQASWSLTLPGDPALAGRTVSTQAIHMGGVFPFALSNAQDLLLDF